MKEKICPIMTERCGEKRLCCQPGYCTYCGYFKNKNEFDEVCYGCKVNMKPWYQFILDFGWWINRLFNKTIGFKRKLKGGMIMWVATDKDGRQLLFQGNKPWRESYGEYDRELSHWTNWEYSLELISPLFPDLKWDDEPIEVELVRKKESQ
jgi:hypothetical protein